MMKAFYLVFLGGGLGALLRYLLSSFFIESFYHSFIPNILGCFVLGFFSVTTALSSDLKLFLIVGLLGGLTTYSGYVMYMMTDGLMIQKILLYFFLQNTLGVGFFFLGMRLRLFLAI